MCLGCISEMLWVWESILGSRPGTFLGDPIYGYEFFNCPRQKIFRKWVWVWIPKIGYEYKHGLYPLPVTCYTDTRYRPGMYDCNSLYGWNLSVSTKSCIRND